MVAVKKTSTERKPAKSAQTGSQALAHKSEGDAALPAQDSRSSLSAREYDKALEKLHIELVSLQEWVQHHGLKVCIVFEGRDGAGKGGSIKALTERVSPRVFRVVALPAPTERERVRCMCSAMFSICPLPVRW